jgi:hypothetical protein
MFDRYLPHVSERHMKIIAEQPESVIGMSLSWISFLLSGV